MGYTVKKLLAIAAAEIGYKEKETNSQLDNATANAGNGNYTKYARDLHAAGYYQASKQGYAWCDMFVDWCFLQLCGGDPDVAQQIECQTGPYGAGCKFSAQYYKAQGRFYTDNPKAGDQIFFSNYAHTGIVEKIVGNVVHTIEGNTSNQVARRTYTLGSSKIDGYGRPFYDVENAAVVTGTISTGTEADEVAIRDYLKGKGLSIYGVYGVMANLFKESGLKSNNLQNTGNTKLNLTDAEYTAEIDAGERDFVDGNGYGLAQWTYPTRKKALLEFAKDAAKSIGDWRMQMDFLWKELQGYTSLLELLKTTTSIREASDAFMCQFECPADQSEDAKKKRAACGQKYYDKYETQAETATRELKKGDIVSLSADAVYYSGKEIPEWVKERKWILRADPVGDRAVIDKSVDGKFAICSPVNVKYLVPDEVYVPDVGDRVRCLSTVHYRSANSDIAIDCKPGYAIITAIYKLGQSKHPYHLIAEDGSASTVYGWVNEGTFVKA